MTSFWWKLIWNSAVKNVSGKGFTYPGKSDILILDRVYGIPGQRRENMKCPFCSEENTKVIDSRPADDNSSIRRRRQCEKCGKRFTTYEKLETIPLIVIKKDQMREPYDRSKIEKGVFRSCIKRPISIDQINELVDSVESTVFNLGEKEVPSGLIGEILMDKLQELDPVAYVRFASVYREFKDVNTFVEEIKKLLDSQNSSQKA